MRNGARRIVVMSQNHGATTSTSDISSGDDRSLAEQALETPDAFGHLYERYLDRIYVYCQRRVSSRQVAEDLTATIFERAFSRLDSYRGGSFRAWLFRIAHNAVTDHYRRRRPSIPWEPHMSGADDEPSPEELAIARDEHVQLQLLLQSLTGSQRQVVELRLAGLTGGEIADVLDRSPESVKMLQYRALERMRAQISSHASNAENSDD
jgi:RNA polymerase sigma-70 factor, ECF subfamily